MSGSNLCIPRNETVQPSYFQNRFIMFCLPIATFINRSKTHECRNWERGRSVLFLGIHKSDFWYSVNTLNSEHTSISLDFHYLEILLWEQRALGTIMYSAVVTVSVLNLAG